MPSPVSSDFAERVCAQRLLQPPMLTRLCGTARPVFSAAPLRVRTRLLVRGRAFGSASALRAQARTGPAPTATTTATNEVWSWGGGHLAGLGHGDYRPVAVPKSIAALRDQQVVSVAAGWTRNYAVTHTGHVWHWGWGKTFKLLLTAQRLANRVPGLLEVLQRRYMSWLTYALSFRGGEPTPQLYGSEEFGGAAVVQIVTGGDHTVALDELGRVWSWGVGYYGQLGHGDHTTQTHVQHPRLIQALWPTTATDGGATAPVDASLSLLHKLGKSSPKGAATTLSASLSRADAAAGKKPTKVRIAQVSAGFQHTLLLGTDGRVWATGKGMNGALGVWRVVDGAESDQIERKTANAVHKRLDVPACLHDLNGADEARHQRPLMGLCTQVAAGFAHSVFLDRDGKVWTCGKNHGGELGVGDFADGVLPKRVDGGGQHLQRVVKVATGQHHTVALTASGQVFTWGISKQGQCGRLPRDAVVNAEAARKTWSTSVAERVKSMPVPGTVDLSHIPLASRTIVDVFAGFYDTLLLNSRGECIVFGGQNVQTRYSHTPTLLTAEALAAAPVPTADSAAGTGDDATADAAEESAPVPLPLPLVNARLHTIAFGLNHALAVVSPTPRSTAAST